MAEDKKAPLPTRQQAQAANNSQGMAHGARASSKNLQDLQEERKEMRANAGARVLAGTARAPLPTNGRSPTNEFANAPQYTKQGHQL